ncbi:hydroxyacylglutathione hydrolase [Nocardia otitidiscaviarum]|uniref:Hydroxyacylglutathione hydrolase n=1 Tax=Nocardia otitidiscaviarum TaxID=1823 RepID=A0A378YAD9_9NOCA|nr:MBL fold metallo-hydrolase [Nocardia otitidiscaviarum]MBF6178527.1 MBL fold metallo-hydrolase [Nocardia otitidiscaviarum]MBF6482578.1 MBL fold metallo-hydrolase [Nocardia otitidiscaviarum]MCP9622829.1 MBL fold metallo-hydrolase [Nocardia otitidiscaviarum]QDP77525.1 MBL fold metallo-hydrolase [Nocardia otitidiscaviarum]SUA73481.1 hydroxyacylglutathione hydrolase [Nocardia otitidiscaviarum]
MERIATDLWVTETQNPAPGLTTRAYLWTRPEGNVLFYNTSIESEFDRMAELGGVADQYLSHQDEITSTLATLKERFGTRLHLHESEADLVTATTVDDPFTTRHTAFEGLEVIPTPGHTVGSTNYLATIAGKRYLFTGDTIIRGEDGRWWAGYLEGFSDKDTLVASLDVLAELTPDVVVSSAFLGESGVTELGERPWAELVGEAREGLLAGRSLV